MKTLLLALLLMHTGCATIASETKSPAGPSAAQGDAPVTCELPRLREGAGVAKNAEPAFAVTGGHLMMTEPGASSQARPLWPITEGPISWTRFVSLGSGGYAIVVRQRDTLLVGTLDPDRKPLGELARIPARHVIGTPAVVASGDVAMVTWAQGETTGCTSLVGATFAAGARPGPVQRIPGTECTEEHSARTPILGSAAEGRFVLAFTEIGVWSSQAVAMVFDESYHRIGGRLVLKTVMPASEQVSAREFAERAVCTALTASGTAALEVPAPPAPPAEVISRLEP